MTREELIRYCGYYKGEDFCPEGVDHIYWMLEESYVFSGGKAPYNPFYESYYNLYGERTYRGIPYGILARIYTYVVDKTDSTFNSLEEFHKYLDTYYLPLARRRVRY